MCDFNGNQLLDLFFHEVSTRQEKKIQNHVNHCRECQDYLILLQQTDLSLHQLSERKPKSDTFDQIMKKIDTKPENLPAPKPSFPLFPTLWIPISALAIVTVIILVKNEIIHLPIWQVIENLWIVRQLGPLGVSAFLVFLAGTIFSLLLSPVLIFETRTKQYQKI